jgi:hypothetical protein
MTLVYFGRHTTVVRYTVHIQLVLKLQLPSCCCSNLWCDQILLYFVLVGFYCCLVYFLCSLVDGSEVMYLCWSHDNQNVLYQCSDTNCIVTGLMIK